MLREVKGGLLPVTIDPEWLEDLDPEEAAAVMAAKERMQSCVRRYLGLEDGQLVSLPQCYRQASFRWCRGLNNALQVVTGHGLEQFATRGTKVEVLAEGRRGELAAWVEGPTRTLAVAADQHSVGCTGTSFLQSKGYELGLDLLMDPPPPLLELREAWLAPVQRLRPQEAQRLCSH